MRIPRPRHVGREHARRVRTQAAASWSQAYYGPPGEGQALLLDSGQQRCHDIPDQASTRASTRCSLLAASSRAIRPAIGVAASCIRTYWAGVLGGRWEVDRLLCRLDLPVSEGGSRQQRAQLAGLCQRVLAAFGHRSSGAHLAVEGDGKCMVAGWCSSGPKTLSARRPSGTSTRRISSNASNASGAIGRSGKNCSPSFYWRGTRTNVTARARSIRMQIVLLHGGDMLTQADEERCDDASDKDAVEDAHTTDAQDTRLRSGGVVRLASGPEALGASGQEASAQDGGQVKQVRADQGSHAAGDIGDR